MYGAAKDNVTHVFQTMSSSGQIVYSLSNTHAVTALCTYHCTGKNAEFFTDLVYKKQLSINLPTYETYVTTSAIDSLSGLQIQYYHESGKDPGLQLTLSRDSITWSAPIVISTTTNLGACQKKLTATFTPGRYYVRISNNVAKKASIDQLVYSFGECPNCFMYYIEE